MDGQLSDDYSLGDVRDISASTLNASAEEEGQQQ